MSCRWNIERFHLVSSETKCVVCFRRWEAVPMQLGGMRLAFRPIRWTDAALPQTHGGEAIQMHRVQSLLLSLGPSGAAHEAPPKLMDFCTFKHFIDWNFTRRSNIQYASTSSANYTPGFITNVLQEDWTSQDRHRKSVNRMYSTVHMFCMCVYDECENMLWIHEYLTSTMFF